MTGIASVHPSAPRPSASLIVVNARNEILFVHRNPQAQSFGGVHVFPGGNYDAAQDDSYQMTAIRETFEESGVLLASSRTQTTLLSDAVVDSSRRSIHAQQMLFKDFLKEHNLETDRKYLLPFTEWVTPPQVPRRFHTRFYVAFLPSSSTTTSDFSHGTIQHRLPTSDGGLEVIAARFIHPLDALAEFRSSKIALMPPQYYLITTLAGVLHGREATLEQQARVRELAAGAFGSMVINPRGHPGGQDQDGRSVLTYEGDETRGGSKGRLHRSLVRFGKKGIPTEIVLLRNFDVFTEIEHQAFSKQSRL
ncbi:hypothetical protein HETIRDRAFT_425132 [Heterobasidion irregulare TC 32-1]|uniref:Nudix hydrolase domain-containing protein n=1 Tax=Heterobasidion irregulare (strain TC 32-1) TaxID=747525 RepID=W4KKC2_HETIT|nr:uncharacterized protein HETIRDRAFT_425132 [Heterobasidion irregulare TC 32-1]ETW86174.1 hypothetical protein HETIRDRAFT_425132 [Heterobasidion irregulare TC 32-1]